MSEKKNLAALIHSMSPYLHAGNYVFVTVADSSSIDRKDCICELKEQEGSTIVLAQEKADVLQLPYSYVASWITLTIHSSLEAVGLTAAFSTALAEHNISCNVMAGYYHDHIFVDKNNAQKAIEVLNNMRAESECI